MGGLGKLTEELMRVFESLLRQFESSWMRRGEESRDERETRPESPVVARTRSRSNTVRLLIARSDESQYPTQIRARARNRVDFPKSRKTSSSHRIPVTDEYRSVAQADLISGNNDQGRRKGGKLNVSHVSVKTSESWRRLVTIWRLF